MRTQAKTSVVQIIPCLSTARLLCLCLASGFGCAQKQGCWTFGSDLAWLFLGSYFCEVWKVHWGQRAGLRFDRQPLYAVLVALPLPEKYLQTHLGRGPHGMVQG